MGVLRYRFPPIPSLTIPLKGREDYFSERLSLYPGNLMAMGVW